ncbi:MAG: DMT family transporter [Candidatus Nomurabacteria bacterium]|jgi:drug/metabolite transporter (DMT)-like permease|nr:DMT family transporter [Candidatus Nomurabacteria bacterium]
MTNKKTKRANYALWLVLGLAVYILSSPNAMVAKILFDNEWLDTFSYSVIRYSVMILFTLPVAVYGVFKNRKAVAKHWRSAVFAGVCLSLSGVAYTLAIELGKASHVNIINLLTPIVLVVLSAKIIHDKVSHRATIGITLAAIGGVLVVATPMIISGAIESSVSPASVALSVFNAIIFPFSMVYMRRANEAGVPLALMLTISCSCTILIALVLEPIMYGRTVLDSVVHLTAWEWFVMVAYIGIFVALIVRVVSVKAYEAVGSAVAGGFEYLHTLLAIILPIIVLHETLAPEILAGALLILIGIYLTESHHHMNSHVHLVSHHTRRKTRRQ